MDLHILGIIGAQFETGTFKVLYQSILLLFLVGFSDGVAKYEYGIRDAQVGS